MRKETVPAKCLGHFDRWWLQLSAEFLGQICSVHCPVPEARSLAGRRGADRSLDCSPGLASMVKYDRLHFTFSWAIVSGCRPRSFFLVNAHW